MMKKRASSVWDCRNLTRAEVPQIPTEGATVDEERPWAHGGDGGLRVDADVDGDHCRWRLTPRGEVRIFIHYWPKAQQDEKGPWKERYVMPDDLTTQAA